VSLEEEGKDRIECLSDTDLNAVISHEQISKVNDHHQKKRRKRAERVHPDFVLRQKYGRD